MDQNRFLTMDKSKKSFYTAITGIAYTIVNSVLNLIVVRWVIVFYGSDFNGVNTTANQFITMLMILEGGFTIATNVALFRPLSFNDHETVNGIISATRITFMKIALLVFGVGMVASILYSFIIKSTLPWIVTVPIFMMTVVSTAFDLFYAVKFSIIMQSEQREYLLNIIRTITTVLSQLFIIVIIFSRMHMLWVRFAIMSGVILSSILIGYVCKRRYPYLDYKSKPNFKAIKGTGDVMAQKLTNMVYATAPFLVITATAGAVYTSVYAVYYSVTTLVKSAMGAFINAPRMGFGRLITEQDNEYVRKVFFQYEFIVIYIMFCLLSTAIVLIMPFIRLYTSGISDISYENWYIASILITIAFIEIIHIPSGNIINMAGLFKISRNYQLIACAVLIITITIGVMIDSFYGVVIAVLITAIFLAACEILYIHVRYFKKALPTFFRILFCNTALSAIMVTIEMNLLPSITGFFTFFIACGAVTVINSTLLLIMNIFFNREIAMGLLSRLRPYLKRFQSIYLKIKKQDRGCK